jgi:hypothetical protein
MKEEIMIQGNTNYCVYITSDGWKIIDCNLKK